MRVPMIVAAIVALAGAAAAADAPQAAPTIVVGDPGPDGTRIDKDGVFANFFLARQPGARPAILLLGGAEGGLQSGNGGPIKPLTDEGYDVLYLCYFGCPGTPPHLANVPLETFDLALAFLRAQPGVDPERIAVVGGSKGAEAALLVASRDPKLKAVVAGMPSSVTWPGVVNSLTMQPSWTSGGAPVPFLPYAFASFATGGIFGLYRDALPTIPQHPDAVIPVERIGGPVLLICGEADALWPSCPMADQISDRLTAKGRPAANILRYKDAGHQVFGAPVDKTKPHEWLASLGGSADGNAAAREDSWPKVLAFLRAALRP